MPLRTREAQAPERQRRTFSFSTSSAPCCRPYIFPGIPETRVRSILFGRIEVRSTDEAATWNGGLGRSCSYSGATGGGSIRAFGGQSVVPWELALFLVEEMKGEGVEPGAVVYTAALAECRWAGQKRHVEYLLEQMEAERMSIVPGIPGATDDELPPSQAPPLFGKLPETPPNSSLGNLTRQYQQPSAAPEKSGRPSVSRAASIATTAARTADTALATVEEMWAKEKDEPSPRTCRAALDACAAGGQWERALSLVRDSAMAMAAESDYDAQEDADLSEKVERLALAGDWDGALLLVRGNVGPSD